MALSLEIHIQNQKHSLLPTYFATMFMHISQVRCEISGQLTKVPSALSRQRGMVEGNGA